MGASGGSIQEISVDGRVYQVASDADATIDLGGYEAEQRVNGDGSTRKILMRKPWKIENLVISIDDLLGDLEALQGIANLTGNVDITITLVNDVVYGGSGTVTGPVAKSTQATTSTISLSGPGNAQAQ
jgi:hypothetical protein